MLYQLAEYQRALLAPFTAWAANAAKSLVAPDSPLVRVPGAAYFAAGYDILYRLGKTWEKPTFGIAAIEHDGHAIPVVEQVVLEKPFCRLLRFAHDAVELDATTRRPTPTVLVCAPLAGHHAVMLRDVVHALLPEHVVYVTDWKDARGVPLAEGPFHLDDYVAQLQTFIRWIGAEPLHVLAVCQATVPALAAISLLASAGEPTPASLILMGGPIDARRNPSVIDRLVARHPLAWFQWHLIQTVPHPYPGAGRKVYPSFLQMAGLLGAQPCRLVEVQRDYFLDLVQGEVELAEMHRRIYEAHLALLDLAAEFYLDTVQVVFHEFRLARGNWRIQGQAVRPQDIRTTALLTIEGERDAISARGQTQAAHDLCRSIAARDKRHVTVRRCGHYDLFCGPRWRTDVFPDICALTRRGT
ncbi:polyhydroxyalkanoate depolymerase [Cupriavidus sp. NPDC089707]|uniref:polyhydroxyalkanoate depolymerase n=1 Tax=Cupriavidus sp. NPDC089707 TaxID=3363963 RepID=UPI003830EE3B